MTTYIDEAWTALGDGTRRLIFQHLLERPQAVGELAADFPVSRPAVSQHLKVLREAGLVLDRRDGNRRIYQVDPTGLAGLRDQLDQFWGRAMENYREIVESPIEEES